MLLELCGSSEHHKSVDMKSSCKTRATVSSVVSKVLAIGFRRDDCRAFPLLEETLPVPE
jgi:hypothetical protein